MPVRKPAYDVFWDKFAKLYTPLQENKNKTLYDEICLYIDKYIDKNTDVLELACGTGQITVRLCDKAKSWEATDFSENMITEAGKRCNSDSVRFALADASNLPYSDESFDTVIIANALHIMPCPDEALGQIARVMKKDSVLIAPTFVYDGEATVKRSVKLRVMKSFGFQTFGRWTSQQYKDFVQSHGFIIEESKLFGDDFLPECVLICKKGG